MKVKLLRKLRRKARNQISIHSITKEGSLITDMSIGYDNAKYANIFNLFDTEEDVMRTVEHIYIEDYILKRKVKLK